LIEFTGERVIPDRVDVDLWNEHLARYAFAARLAAGRRVLDAGCGTGYGCAALAGQALSVTGLDIAPEAIAYARESYETAGGVRFVEGSCSAMPLPDAGFDLVTAFEVIEHLADWQAFLLEGRRVLAPGGVLLISTPNRDYYAESRRLSGPNPFHAHEFAFDEFQSVLQAVFPHVYLYLQNHVEGIAFQPASAGGQDRPELRQGDQACNPHDAHFFLAACSAWPHPAPPPFVYVPTTANVLHERELHIGKLEIDVNRLRQEKEKLVDMFRVQEAELQQTAAGFEAQIATLGDENRAKTEWARELDENLAAAAARILELQGELETTAAGFEAQIATLGDENRAKTEWARQLDEKLGVASLRIGELQAELETTAAGFEAQVAALAGENDAKTAWARRLDEELSAASVRIVELQSELQQVAAGYQAKVAEIEAENRAKAEWISNLSAALEQSNRGASDVAEQLSAALSRVFDLEGQLAQVAASTQSRLDDLQSEVCAKTKWGQQLTADLGESNRRSQELAGAVEGYAAKVAEVEAENDAKTAWARRLEAEAGAKGKDLVHCVEVLHATEKTLEERTAWALRLQEQLEYARASRWVKLGNRFGLGPKLNGE
jgi:ubiquinone/menaquinone biosynthesis C-methylase UbiE